MLAYLNLEYIRWLLELREKKIKNEEISQSLSLVVYTPRGGTKKSALKGCLPEPEIDSAALGFCEIPASLFVNSSQHDES